MSMNKYDVQNELDDIYYELDKVYDKITEIMDTPINELDTLLNGKVPSLYDYNKKEKGIIDLVAGVLKQIEDLKEKCSDLPDEREED